MDNLISEADRRLRSATQKKSSQGSLLPTSNIMGYGGGNNGQDRRSGGSGFEHRLALLVRRHRALVVIIVFAFMVFVGPSFTSGFLKMKSTKDVVQPTLIDKTITMWRTNHEVRTVMNEVEKQVTVTVDSGKDATNKKSSDQQVASGSSGSHAPKIILLVDAPKPGVLGFAQRSLMRSIYERFHNSSARLFFLVDTDPSSMSMIEAEASVFADILLVAAVNKSSTERPLPRFSRFVYALKDEVKETRDGLKRAWTNFDEARAAIPYIAHTSDDDFVNLNRLVGKASTLPKKGLFVGVASLAETVSGDAHETEFILTSDVLEAVVNTLQETPQLQKVNLPKVFESAVTTVLSFNSAEFVTGGSKHPDDLDQALFVKDVDSTEELLKVVEAFHKF